MPSPYAHTAIIAANAIAAIPNPRPIIKGALTAALDPAAITSVVACARRVWCLMPKEYKDAAGLFRGNVPQVGIRPSPYHYDIDSPHVPFIQAAARKHEAYALHLMEYKNARIEANTTTTAKRRL